MKVVFPLVATGDHRVAPQLGDCGNRRKNHIGKGRGNKLKERREGRKEKKKKAGGRVQGKTMK